MDRRTRVSRRQLYTIVGELIAKGGGPHLASGPQVKPEGKLAPPQTEKALRSRRPETRDTASTYDQHFPIDVPRQSPSADLLRARRRGAPTLPGMQGTRS